jgi:hypothetical protein
MGKRCASGTAVIRLRPMPLSLAIARDAKSGKAREQHRLGGRLRDDRRGGKRH